MSYRYFGVISILIVSPLWATDYYCDPNGNDANDGSSWEEAWQTMSRAMDANTMTPSVAGGDTVYFKGGNYGAYVETLTSSRTSYIEYKAGSGSVPSLTSITTTGSGATYNFYLVFDGFNISPSSSQNNAIVDLIRSGYIRFLNTKIQGKGYDLAWNTSIAVKLYASTNVVINSCTIDGSGSPFFGGCYFGIYSASTGSSDVNIANCDISETNHAIYQKGDNWTIQYNNIHDNYSDGILLNDGNTVNVLNNTITRLIYYIPDLNEITTDTTWNVAGTVMTNPHAIWGVGEPTGWNDNVEIHVWSGTNCKLGGESMSEHTVQSVDSPTQITLASTISSGGQPSNVHYRFQTRAHFDLIQVQTGSGKTLSNLRIANNSCSYSSHQGFLLQPTGVVTNAIVENNLIYGCNWQDPNYNSYSLLLSPRFGDNDVVVRNNTIVKIFSWDGGKIRIKSGFKPTSFKGNIFYRVDDEVVPDVNNSDYNIYLEQSSFGNPGSHSIIVDNLDAFKSLFNNYDTNDFTLKSYSLAVDFMPLVDAAATDILVNSRVDIPDVNHSSDSANYADAGAYEIQTYDPVNNIPVWDTCADKIVNENQEVTFTVIAHDTDDDPCTYSLLNPPSGAAFNPTTRTFAWTPDFNVSQSGHNQEFILIFNVNDTVVDTRYYPPVKITVINVPQHTIIRKH